MQIVILDSTLREGRQSLYFDNIDRIQEEYIKLASKIGITDFEFRNPLHNKKDSDVYHKLQQQFPNINFHTHVFLSKNNIEEIKKTKLQIKNISTFISTPLDNEVIENLDQLLEIKNKKFRVAIEKTPLIKKSELDKIIKYLLSQNNINRITFSDTLGNFTPKTINNFIKYLSKFDFIEKNIEFHLHNDFALASANSCELLENLKNIKKLYLSVSMFGIGDRNGILSHGDLISNLIRLNIKHNYKLKHYGSLVRLFEKEKITFNRDPLNSSSYYHFASSHIIRGLKDKNYYSINPQKIGLKEKFVITELTDSYIFDFINNKLLNSKLSGKPENIKKLILDKMHKLNKKYIFLSELISALKK